MKKTSNSKRTENKFWKKNIQAKSLENRLAKLRSELRDNAEYLTKAKVDAEEKSKLIIQLHQVVAERESYIAALTSEELEKNIYLEQLKKFSFQQSFRLQQIRKSFPWKLFKPLRAIQKFCLRKLKIEALPLHDLIRTSGGWKAVGGDPQFLLVTDRAWHGLTGWCYLEITIESEYSLETELYFDEGGGFNPTNFIRCCLDDTGTHQVPLYIPYGCQAIRFDPHNAPTTFKLLDLKLLALGGQPELASEFLEQATVYEALGGGGGNVPGLNPRNQIQRHDGPDFCWRSDGVDPWFNLKGMENCLKAGWYQISLRIRTDLSQGNARMYFDFGKGYAEVDSILLPFSNDKTVSRLCYLRGVPIEIRLDPFECSGLFSIKILEIENRDSGSAHLEVCRRLSECCEDFRGQEAMQILAIIKDLAQKGEQDLPFTLHSYYNSSFLLKGKADAVTYADWIVSNEKKSNDEELTQTDWQSFSFQPCISILLPVYDVPEKYLQKTLDSVLGQSYSNWQLCIADDASPGAHIRVILERIAEADNRVKVTFRKENGHISAASNSALELATGEYIALLDHDDELAPDAFYWVVEALNRNPKARILYSDEDKIDAEGLRSEPHFKSAWNPDMFFSQNYISHLGVYQRGLISLIGGFRLGVEGSQDQDLILRCLPHLNPEEIVHIPKVLYHWRVIEGSTAKAAGEKNYTSDAGIKSLRDYLYAQGSEGTIVTKGLAANTYRVKYAIPDSRPLVSLLVPTRDGVELLESCVRSIIDKTTYINFEIIVIDNGSVKPETLSFFETITKEYSRVKVIRFDQPFNYSAINNYGVEKAKGEIIGLINNDIEVISPEWLEEMLSHALRPEIGCVGAKLYYQDDTIQHAGVILGLGGVAGHSHKYFPGKHPGYFHRLNIVHNISAVTAACLVVRKSLYEQVGGLEEDNLQIAFNDVDFCLKVRSAGYRNLWTPYAELYHYESKSRGEEDTPEKRKRFNSEISFMKKKWGDLLMIDPYYSPNLTLDREDFSLNDNVPLSLCEIR